MRSSTASSPTARASSSSSPRHNQHRHPPRRRPTPATSTLAKRWLHTLKGNSMLYGFSRLADIRAQLEDDVESSNGRPPPPEQRDQLAVHWSGSCQEQLVDAGRGAQWRGIELTEDEYRAGSRCGCARRAPSHVPGAAHPLVEAGARRRFAPASACETRPLRIAERVGKPRRIRSTVEYRARRHPTGACALQAVLVLLRARDPQRVDHGIESRAEERMAAGKSGRHHPFRRTRVEQAIDSWCRVEDDGRGCGLGPNPAARRDDGDCLAQTDDDLVDALFADGLSTKDVRRPRCRDAGSGCRLCERPRSQLWGHGSRCASEPGRGTSTFRFCFPDRIVLGDVIYFRVDGMPQGTQSVPA